ncbi:MAG: hypothetical protein A2Z11_01050 [Candidatus Woykebacteria bacterium RBG_16_43_9]|uniref:Uncharacterized protein n=1 Tax=Candidatus Woykebacteria bacterium RBG_16_43_9 TaxID=1802596 RepID=A0A1G1WC20_9BACT|nr:MAG: hypothetical protein A2Z11_01050 [Candidatus Woykebacteria bacterium RBG_16_43_9]
MTENIKEFISIHNSHILNLELAVNYKTIAHFAAKKNIALEDLSIEKHRLPFINWITSLSNSQI